MPDNTVEILIRAVAETGDLKKMQAELQNFAKTAGYTDAQMKSLNENFDSFATGVTNNVKGVKELGAAHQNASMHLFRLSSGLSQITGAVAAVNPAYRSIIGLTDNLAFGMLQAGARATTFSQGLTASLAYAFHPVTLGIIGLTAVLGYFINAWVEATKKKEEFDKAMASSNVGKVTGEIGKLKDTIDELNRSIAETKAKGPVLVGELALVNPTKIAEAESKRTKAIEDTNTALGKQAELNSTNYSLQVALSALDAKIATTENPAAKARLEVQKELLKNQQDFLEGKINDAEITDRQAVANARLAASLAGVSREQSKAAAAANVGVLESRVGVEQAKLIGGGGFTSLDALHKAQKDALQASSALAEQQAGATGNSSVVAALRLTNANKALSLTLQQISEDEKQTALTTKLATDAVADQVKLVELQLSLEQQYADKQNELQKSARDAVRDMRAQTAVEALPGGTPQEQLEKQIAGTRLQFEQRRQALRYQQDLNAASQETVDLLEEQINATTKLEDATVQSLRNSKDAMVQLNQSLSDVFVQGFDDAYNQLFDTTKSFGQRIVGLFSGIGESLVKALLHGMLTVPFAQSLAAGGGPLGVVFSLLGKIPGFMNLFGSISGALGVLPSAVSFSVAGAGQGFAAIPFLAQGGLIKGSPYPKPDWVRDLPPSVHRFASGGRVMGGPILGVLGEGGQDEYVVPASKMKNRSSGDSMIHQNIYVVDERPKSLQPNDVVAIVSDSAMRNGPIGKAIAVVSSRSR